MDKFLKVGEVLKPQGIRGEVKIKPLTDDAEDFKKFKKIYLDETAYKVLSCVVREGFVYLMLAGVYDRNAAELLRFKTVRVDREDIPPLPDGRYYVVDIIGCSLVDEQGSLIGTITDIFSSNTDVYTVDCGEYEMMFATPEGVIVSVDVEGRKVTVDRKRFEEVAVKQ